MGSNPTSTANAPTTGGIGAPGRCAARWSAYGISRASGGPSEPQSTALLLLLIGVFGALMWWLVVAKQLVFRVLAACLAFIPAMLFGVAAVNKYYDYYQNWNSAISDMTNSERGNRGAERPPAVSGVRLSTFHGAARSTRALAAQDGTRCS